MSLLSSDRGQGRISHGKDVLEAKIRAQGLRSKLGALLWVHKSLGQDNSQAILDQKAGQCTRPPQEKEAHKTKYAGKRDETGEGSHKGSEGSLDVAAKTCRA